MAMRSLRALVYRLAGADVVEMLLVQVAGSALTLYLTYRLAAMLFGAGTGLLALWVSALYGPAVYYACKPEKASFAALALTAALFGLVSARERFPRWIVAGFLLGLAGLLRGNALFVAVAALLLQPGLGAWEQRGQRPGRETALADECGVASLLGHGTDYIRVILAVNCTRI